MTAIIVPRRGMGVYAGPPMPAPEWGAVLLFANGALYTNPTGEQTQVVAPGSSGPLLRGNSQLGPTTEFNGASSMVWGEPVLRKAQPEATVVAIHRPASSATGYVLSLADYAADDTLFMLGHDSGLNTVRFRDSDYGNNITLSGTANPTNVTVTVGTVYRRLGEKSLWKNGTKEAQTTSGGGASNTVNSFQFRNSSVGVLRRGSNSNFYPGGIGFVAVLPYAVSDADMVKLMADPWQMLYSAPRRLYFGKVAALPGAALAATAQARASGVATLSNAIRLQAVAGAVGSASAGLSSGVRLQAVANAAASAGATVTTGVRLQAALTAQALATAALTARIGLAAAAQGAASAAAALTTGPAGLSSAAVSSALALASLSTGVRLQAHAIGVAAAGAVLTVPAAGMAAAAASRATASANLATAIPLQAQAFAVANASAGLGGSAFALSAAALSRAQVSAHLLTGISLQANAWGESRVAVSWGVPPVFGSPLGRNSTRMASRPANLQTAKR